jgi:hypothetical protein
MYIGAVTTIRRPFDKNMGINIFEVFVKTAGAVLLFIL